MTATLYFTESECKIFVHQESQSVMAVNDEKTLGFTVELYSVYMDNVKVSYFLIKIIFSELLNCIIIMKYCKVCLRFSNNLFLLVFYL